MKIAAELCLIGLAVSATDDVTSDNADNQVEGSAGTFLDGIFRSFFRTLKKFKIKMLQMPA